MGRTLRPSQKSIRTSGPSTFNCPPQEMQVRSPRDNILRPQNHAQRIETGRSKSESSNRDETANVLQRKELRSLIGLAGWFYRFIPFLRPILKPLQILHNAKSPYLWEDIHQEALQKIKAVLITEPLLQRPQKGANLKIQVDASENGLGAVLLQQCSPDDAWYPIMYFSKNFSEVQSRYS